jgi:anti-anti-sigma factor
MQVQEKTLPDRVRSATHSCPPPVPPFTAAAFHLDAQRVVVTLHGELDLMSVPVLVGCLEEIEPSVRELVFDFAGLQFIDCAGLHAIAHAAHGLAVNGGSVTIRSARPNSRRLLELLRFDRLVTIQ